MPTLAEKAAEILRTKSEAARGVTVSYARGATTLSITAVPAQVRSQALLTNVVDMSFGERDYLIRASLLTLGEPAEGDRITETLAGESKMFEVIEPGQGEPSWRWHDRAETTYRIHTKRVT